MQPVPGPRDPSLRPLPPPPGQAQAPQQQPSAEEVDYANRLLDAYARDTISAIVKVFVQEGQFCIKDDIHPPYATRTIISHPDGYDIAIDMRPQELFHSLKAANGIDSTVARIKGNKAAIFNLLFQRCLARMVPLPRTVECVLLTEAAGTGVDVTQVTLLNARLFKTFVYDAVSLMPQQAVAAILAGTQRV